MTHTRTAFVNANWQADIVGGSRDGRVHKPPLEARVGGNTRPKLAT
jgi:hypothetical protein